MPQATITPVPTQDWRAPVHPPAPRTNPLAVAGFVLSLLGVLSGTVPLLFLGTLVCGTIGVILSVKGLQASRRSGAPRKTLSAWGLGLGVFALVLGLIGLLIVSAVFGAVATIDRRVSRGAPEAPLSQPSPDASRVTTTTAVAVLPTGPATISPLLAGNAKPAIPPGAPAPGQIAVVVNGPYVGNAGGGSVPIVIVNRKAQAVTDIRVTANARNGSGALIGTATDHGVYPATLAPGEMGIGMVYFQPGLGSPSGLRIEYGIEAEDVGSRPSPFGHRDLKVTEVNNTGQAIVGRVQNQTEDTVSGPINILAICFTADGHPLSEHGDFATANQLGPGGLASFSADLYNDRVKCPTFLAGAFGYNY